MRKQILFLLLIISMLSFSSCSNNQSNQTNLEGYWLDEYGNSISFDGDSQVVADNQSGIYKIYDKDKMTMDFDGYVVDFSFSIDLSTDTLIIDELESGNHYVYYGDEKKQSEIQNALRIAVQEQAEYEAQLAEEQEKANRIDALEKQISDIDKKISGIQFNIDYEQNTIDMYQADIARDGDEYPDLVESWKELISISEDTIAGYNHDIEILNAQKSELQRELSSLQ